MSAGLSQSQMAKSRELTRHVNSGPGGIAISWIQRPREAPTRQVGD